MYAASAKTDGLGGESACNEGTVGVDAAVREDCGVEGAEEGGGVLSEEGGAV